MLKNIRQEDITMLAELRKIMLTMPEEEARELIEKTRKEHADVARLLEIARQSSKSAF